MRTYAGVALLIAVVLTCVAGAQPFRFVLGIVRLDGRIVPFAAYEDGRWEQAWPAADEIIAETLDKIPHAWRRRGEAVPRTWHVWPASGARVTRAHVQGIEVVDAHCSSQLALTTDLPPTGLEHPAKFGVAADRKVPISAIRQVPRSHPSRRDAERVVAASFDRLEAAQARTDGLQLLHKSPAPTPELTALYGETGSAPSPMYFVAERKYAHPREVGSRHDDRCGDVTLVTGWLLPGAGGVLTLRQPTVFLTDCDRKIAQRGLPLAAFRVANRMFWILQQHGWEDESYVIVEIGATNVQSRHEFDGGGC